MALQPLSELISDKNLSDRLREICEVSVVAGYEFLQCDSGIYDISLMAELDIYGALFFMFIITIVKHSCE